MEPLLRGEWRAERGRGRGRTTPPTGVVLTRATLDDLHAPSPNESGAVPMVPSGLCAAPGQEQRLETALLALLLAKRIRLVVESESAPRPHFDVEAARTG